MDKGFGNVRSNAMDFLDASFGAKDGSFGNVRSDAMDVLEDGMSHQWRPTPC